MSERKVINKYIPPNFDPENIPRGKTGGRRQHTVRLMTPYSMRCSTCSEYIYKGKKFNARKETVFGEEYLGLRIFRFYIRCPMCASEITYKTDPKNRGYEAEHGATRNFEPWREEALEIIEKKRRRLEEEENDPMKALENKTFDSKREMDIMDSLDQVRMMIASHEKVDLDALLHQVSAREDPVLKAQNEEDEELVRQFFPPKPKEAQRGPEPPGASRNPQPPPAWVLPRPPPAHVYSPSTLGIRRKQPSQE